MSALEALPESAAGSGMSRILLVRTSAIGDIVFASPFVAALRQRYPEAHIAWLVEPGMEGLLEADPCVDDVILWPKAEWKRFWHAGQYRELAASVRAFSRTLKAQRFDTAIDLQSLLKSGWLTWLSGATQRIGLGSREGSQFLMTRVVPGGGTPGQISSEYRHLAQALGLDTTGFHPRLRLSPTVQRSALDKLAHHGVVSGHYVVFAPFTTRAQKHWTEEAWRALALRVQRDLGLRPVVLGGPGDRDAAQRIAGKDAGALAFAGETTLAEAAAIVEHAALVIGVDTGLSHMAVAFNRPLVALFGSTRPYLDAGRANARVIWLGLECSPCRRSPSCGGAFPCMRDIDPARVLDEARIVLNAEIPS
ncbi:MAG: lipopolysaccharide heptosyltransferase II [Azoarcus sp.]|nr:lipopolysaccharide heptosyltransferase II [Azoarcus sp.]